MTTTTATLTAYAETDPEMNGPAGVSHEATVPVEIIGFRHDEFGIVAVRVKTPKSTFWLDGNDLDDIEIARTGPEGDRG